MDWKLELVSVPVTDVDRAKDFYVERAGFTDYDHAVSDNLSFRAADAYWVCVLDRVRRRSDRPGSGVGAVSARRLRHRRGAGSALSGASR